MRFATLALLAAATAAFAQDPPAKPPAEEYEERKAKIHRNLADEYFKIGEFLTGQKMFTSARSEYNKALHFNPDHEGANKALCKRRDDQGQWEVDPDKKPNMGDNLAGDEKLKCRVQYDKKVDTMGKTIGNQYSSLGDFCASNKMETESVECWKKAIEFDPQNSNARKKLKHERQGKDGPWLPPFESKIRKELREGIAKADGGQPTKEQTKVEADLGLTHEKRKSKNFSIEAGGLTQEKLKVELQHAEHAYAMFQKYFNQQSLFGQEYHFIVLKDKSVHEKYVDRYHPGPAAKKDQARKSAGMGGFPNSEWTLGDRPHVNDWVVHMTAQWCSEHLVGGERHWLHEGLAYHFTKTMLGTAGTLCVDLAGTGSEGGGKNYQDPENWPIVIRTWIREGKDPSIAEVVKATNLAELSGGETVKGWSLIDFLVTEHREKFIDFMQKLRGTKQTDDEKILQEVFGWSWDDLDAKWKAYARSSY